jgi:hypothetical protein
LLARTISSRHTDYYLFNPLQNSLRLTLTHDRPRAISIVSFPSILLILIPTSLITGHEWPYYILDAVPIAFSIGIFNIIYPPEYLPKDRKETIDHPHEPLARSSDELPEHEQFKLVSQGLAEERVEQSA